jgi:glycosyltransferase involved in cell wall biosynthesis
MDKTLFIDKLTVIPCVHDYDYIYTPNINTYFLLVNKKKLLGKLVSNIDTILKIFFTFNNTLTINSSVSTIVDKVEDANMIVYKNIVELINIDTIDKLVFKYNEFTLNQTIQTHKLIFGKHKIKKLKIRFKKIQLDYSNLSKKYIFKKNNYYQITRKEFNYHRGIVEHVNSDINIYFSKPLIQCICYYVDGVTDKDVIIFYKSLDNKNINIENIINSIQIERKILIGRNNKTTSYIEVMNYYYVLGKCNRLLGNRFIETLWDKYLLLSENFLTNIRYCDDKLIRLIMFWYGNNKTNIDIQKIQKYIRYIDKSNMPKIMLVSKCLNSYGGNQKTSLQIYNILTKNNYNVKIICIKPFDIIPNIHNNDVIITTKKNIHTIINNSDAQYVIVNKLNEYFDMSDKINIPSIIITHNSLDPFNNIIDNTISKILTVNYDHISQFYDNKFNVSISRYINYIDTIPEKYIKKKKQTKQLLFVGRLSKEKNINILIEAWKKVMKNRNDLQLIIVGSGDKKYIYKYKNIKYIGHQNFTVIESLLLNSDYLLLPSTTEGLSFSILEAMSYGVPIIASDIIGSNELVINEKTGFLFKLFGYDEEKFNVTNDWSIFKSIDNEDNINKSVNALAETIQKAYSIDIYTYDNMSRKCYDIVKSIYSYENSEKLLLYNLKHNKNILHITNIINNTKNDIYDMKKIENKLIESNYTIIIKIDIDISSTLSNVYRIKQECEINSIKKIVDPDCNYIMFPFHIGKTIHTSSIRDILF